MPALNNIQIEILKLFRNDQSEEELQEIRSLLITYLASKLTMEADKVFQEKITSYLCLKSGNKNISEKPKHGQ
jgi:hypothetical protein